MALPNASPIVKVYYGKPVLPEVSRVLACLYEKEFQMVAFENVDCMPVDLIRLQASTSVPAPFFEDGSKFLFESRAICRYISETYAERGNRYLLGRDLLDRVSIEQWLKSEEQSFDPPSRALVLHLAFSPSSKSYNELLEESDRLAKVLDVYNHRLGESRYLAGDKFTLADLTHLPNSQYIATSDQWGHLFDERENVKRWWEEVSTRHSWSKVVEDIKREEDDDDDEEEEEEMTEEVDESFIGISRPPPKTSLKASILRASIFQPIEASAQLPVKPKTTLTLSKNVGSTSSSVQVTVPERRAFSVSLPAIKGAPFETAKIQSHSTVDSDDTVTQPGDASAKTKQPVTDAKVRMEDSTIPPTSTQVPTTAHADNASTKPSRVASQSRMPASDAKVTMEEAAIPPIGTQESSTTRIDKASTKPTGVASQSTMAMTDAKVTMEQATIPPTSTQVSSTARIDKGSTKPTGVTSQSTMPATDGKVTMGESAITPTNTRVPSTEGIDKTSTKPTGVEKTFFPPSRTEAPPTSKMVPPTKPSLEGKQALPSEQTSTKPASKDQGQIRTSDSKWGQAGEAPGSKEIDEKAYLAAKHKKWEEQWLNPEKFGEEKDTNGIQVEKPTPTKLEDYTPTIPTPATTTTSSETARQDRSTNVPAKEPSESKTATKPKDTTPPAATKGSALGKTSETSPAPTATSQASLSNSTDGTKGEITNKTKNVLDPTPPKNEETTPLATPTAETTTQTARPELTNNKLTTAPEKDQSKSTVRDSQKEPSPGKPTAKPQDTAPAVTALKTTIPDAAQQPPPRSTNEATSRIANKTSNLPTQSPAATFTTATPEPMTGKPNTAPAPETSKPTDPAAQENSSQRAATKKSKETTPSTPESATIPATSQKSSGDIASNTNNLRTQSPTATFPIVTPDPMTNKPNTVPAPETSKPTNPMAKENSSQRATTKEPKETTLSAPKSTTIQAASQKSSSETAGKSQASPTTKQTAPSDEVASKITDVSQPIKAPSKSQSENISQNLGDNITKSEQVKTDLMEASTDTKLDNGFTQNSQTIAQKTPPAADEAPNKTVAIPDTDKAGSVDEIGIARNEDKASPIQTPSKEIKGEPETPDIEKTHPVDEIGIGRTIGEASPIQTPPKEISNKGVLSTQTTPSDTEQATQEQISIGTTLEAKTTSSNDEQGSELPADENSSSQNETAPMTSGSTTTPNTTLKQNETQSGPKMETKTETDKLGTSKSNQTDVTQPNKFDDANSRNEAASETNQNMALQQDQEGNSSNKSSTKPLTEQNSEADSINNPGPDNIK